MDRGHDAVKRKRFDGSAPAPKREKLSSTQLGHGQSQQPSKANAEDIRSAVRDIFKAYKALSDGDTPNGPPFNTLLQASAGDLASQCLAARLLPRFIHKVPDLAEATASALIRLHSQQQDYQDARLNHLAGKSSEDALRGLAAVLKAVQACRGPGKTAVCMVLDYLFSLLPQAAVTDEPSEPEEEGEVAPCGTHTASSHFLHKLLSEALHLHPAITMGHCAARLAAACDPGSSSGGCPEPQVQAGVRLWLQQHLFKERSPSRESTPSTAADGLAAGSAAAAAVTAAGAAAGAGGPGPPRGCLLQAVLDTSEELQAWVMQQARIRAAACIEVRTVIETALQLLPEDKQLVAATLHLHQETAGAAAANAYHSKQQLGLETASSLPQYKQQPLNGINGVGALGRSLSHPAMIERDRGRAGHSNLGTHVAGVELRSQFPTAAGPICRAEACLLVSRLPVHTSQQQVQQALGAEEAWVIKEPGGSSSACCTFKSVLDAAKCYLRHHGLQRLGLQCPAVSLAFADRLPAASAKSSDPAYQPSAYVWAARDAVGDAESITDELRGVGMQLSHVHRVNNAAEPGTLLQTPSAAQAATVVDYLLKKYARSQPQRAAEHSEEQQLPPLPPEVPSAGGRAASRQQQRQGPMPPLPPGPPPNLQQQQQQQLDRGTSAAGSGRTVAPALQQRQGYADGNSPGTRCSSASPTAGAAGAAAAGSSWRNSPGEWSTHISRWGQPPPGPPPLPPGQQATGHAGMSPAGGSGWHPVQQQQQQARWTPMGQPRWGIASSPTPTTAPHHSTLPPGATHPGVAAYAGQASAHAMHAQQQQSKQGSLPLPAAGDSPHALGPGRAASGRNSPAEVLALQQQQQQQQQQPPSTAGLRRALQGLVLWHGSIVKQSVHMCGVVCTPTSTARQGSQQMAGLAPEPRCWPAELHVNFRISVADALDQYAHAPAEQRAIRLLMPLEPDSGDTQQLQQFMDYLNGKDRAGMVKLPALREHGLGPRAIYLIVPKLHICQQLQVGWDGRDVMLLAVVVPHPITTAGGHAGAAVGHKQYRGDR